MPVRPIHLPFEPPLVAGVSYRQAELRDVVEGDVLSVVAADDNPHDPNACEVRTLAGVLLGFIPKDLAPRLRATGPGPWPAYIREVRRTETWGLAIVVGRDRPQECDEPAPTPFRPRIVPAAPDFWPGAEDREIPNENPDEDTDAAQPARPPRAEPDRRQTAPIVAPPPSDTAPASIPQPAPERPKVTAPSGRVLGTLVRVDGDRAIVAKADGAEVTFPLQAVTICAA